MRDQVKILLLQIREHEEVRREEHRCFALYGNINQDQIKVLNAFETPDFAPQVADQYDAVFVGGSSNASVLEPEKYPFVKNCIDLMSYCKEKSIPTFASCFGFQLATLAFGGDIIRSVGEFEMGTPLIQLTPEAKDDVLFHDTPKEFYAVAVHREKAEVTPPGTVSLAYTDECIHAFKVIDKPFWAFQFHPEVDKPILEHRLYVYRDVYTNSLEHYQEVMDSMHETPESNILVKKFIDRVLLSNS